MTKLDLNLPLKNKYLNKIALDLQGPNEAGYYQIKFNNDNVFNYLYYTREELEIYFENCTKEKETEVSNNIDFSKALEVVDKNGGLSTTAELVAANINNSLFNTIISVPNGENTFRFYYLKNGSNKIYYHNNYTGEFNETSRILRNKTVLVTKYLNLYKNGPGGSYFDTPEEAMKDVDIINDYYIQTLKVTFEA